MRESEICDGNYNCKDGSDELCESECLQVTFEGRSIIKKCEEDLALCFPMERYCDGFADCREGSDETWWACTCEDWGLNSCNDTGNTLCLYPHWSQRIGVNNSAQPCVQLFNIMGSDAAEVASNKSG